MWRISALCRLRSGSGLPLVNDWLLEVVEDHPQVGAARKAQLVDGAVAAEQRTRPGVAGSATSTHTGKYQQLSRWLQDQSRDEVNMAFADIEQVLGMPLPPSARRHPTHW
jgi:hypothetical protein